MHARMNDVRTLSTCMLFLWREEDRIGDSRRACREGRLGPSGADNFFSSSLFILLDPVDFFSLIMIHNHANKNLSPCIVEGEKHYIYLSIYLPTYPSKVWIDILNL